MNEKYELLLDAVLQKIRNELDRCYFNKYQQEMKSPFDNTAETYENDTFKVRAYYWGDDEELVNLPNFEYDGLECYWYKYATRGLTWRYKGGRMAAIPADFLADMLDKCFKAIQADFPLDSDEV